MRAILISGASVLAFSTSAMALQPTAAPPSTPNPPPATPNQSTAQSPPQGGIGDIIITAQRRSESLQRAALSVEAANSQQIQRAGVSRPEDLMKLFTGVNIGTGGNVPQIYIRGVGNYATNSNAEGAIAVNVDGVYVSRPWGVRGTFFDLDRVEALKGPQGTLYGRNASGGALNIITKKPQLGETSGYVEGEVGNYSLFGGTAALNLPLSDNVAIRASGRLVRRDGYLKDGYDDEKGEGARLHLLFEPQQGLSVLLSGFYQHDHGKGAGMTLMNPQQPAGAPEFDVWGGPTQPLFSYFISQNNTTFNPNGPPPFILFQQPTKDGFNKNSIYGVSAELNWDLGPATLTVLPAYRYGKHSNLFNVGEYQILEFENDRQTSLEARLAHQSERLKWVFGGYYFDEHQGNQDGHNLRLSQANFTGDEVLDFDGRIRSYAAFGELTYSLTDLFRLTGGLRYTHERRTVDADQLSYAGFIQGVFPPTCDPSHRLPISSPLPFAPCVGMVSNDGRVSKDSLTWKAGLEYDVAPHSLLYATVRTGFKSGGLYSAPPPNSFKPEKLIAYELGSKNRFFDNTLQANLELFYYDYKDHQEANLGPTSDPFIFTFVTANAGRAESYGALLDLLYQPTPNDEIALTAQYDKSKYKTYSYTSPFFFFPVTSCAVTPPAVPFGQFQIDCSGKPIVRTPKWSGHASYYHTFALGNGARIHAGGNVQYSSNYYTSIEFLSHQLQHSFALIDADLTYASRGNKWSVSLWGRNLTKQAVFTSTFHSPFLNNPATGAEGLSIGTLRPPRTFGVTGRVNF